MHLIFLPRLLPYERYYWRIKDWVSLGMINLSLRIYCPRYHCSSQVGKLKDRNKNNWPLKVMIIVCLWKTRHAFISVRWLYHVYTLFAISCYMHIEFYKLDVCNWTVYKKRSINLRAKACRWSSLNRRTARDWYIALYSMITGIPHSALSTLMLWRAVTHRWQVVNENHPVLCSSGSGTAAAAAGWERRCACGRCNTHCCQITTSFRYLSNQRTVSLYWLITCVFFHNGPAKALWSWRVGR